MDVVFLSSHCAQNILDEITIVTANWVEMYFKIGSFNLC